MGSKEKRARDGGFVSWNLGFRFTSPLPENEATVAGVQMLEETVHPARRRPIISTSMAGPWPCSTARRSTTCTMIAWARRSLRQTSAQNTQWQASYDPFGNASVSGTVTQNLRFPGQYFDVESGWNHNGFRDYLPALGRYAEPDPLGRRGSGNNLYVYADNDPTNRIDPSGLWNTYTHHALLWIALRGCGMSNADIWQLQEESDFQDAWQFGGQDPDNAYKHSMASPGQSSQDALNAINGYIAQNLNLAAEMYQTYGDTASASNPTDTWLTPFGDALHTITDSTSPAQ